MTPPPHLDWFSRFCRAYQRAERTADADKLSTQFVMDRTRQTIFSRLYHCIAVYYSAIQPLKTTSVINKVSCQLSVSSNHHHQNSKYRQCCYYGASPCVE